MNLVAGATGVLGSEICSQLAKRGTSVRGLTRPTSSATKIAYLRELGVEIADGDLKQPVSLVDACRGVDAVISTVTTTVSRQAGDTIRSVDLDGQRALIDAARASGVRHFVYVSVSAETPCPLIDAKREVERHLEQSGLTFTILRACIFMEVWLSPALGFDFPNARAQVFGSGQNPLGWVSVADVARFAAASPTTPGARNVTWNIGGPEALSPHQVIRTFEEVSGRTFDVSHVPVEALEAQRSAATDPLEQSFAALGLAIAAGDVIDMRPVLEICPVALTSVRDYVGAVLASLTV
jgi:NADH dehydrogenase